MNFPVPWILLLIMCTGYGAVSAESSEEFGLSSFEAESGEYSAVPQGPPHTKLGSPRLILNPFSIFGNPKCYYNGDEGRCYGEVECLALAGNYGAFCPGLQGLCCLFYRACHQRTSQEVAYFRNLQWPLESELGGSCAFKVIRRSDDFCGLRLTPEKLELMSSPRNCETTQVVVKGAGNRSPMPLCRNSRTMIYNIDFSRVSDVYVEIESTARSAAAWNVKITQVPCSEWGGETTDTSSTIPVGPPVVGTGGTSGGSGGSPGGSGGSTGGSGGSTGGSGSGSGSGTGSGTGSGSGGSTGGGLPPAPQPPAPPPTSGFRGCGKKGPSRSRRDADIDDASVKSRNTETRSWFGTKTTNRNTVANDRRNQPAVLQRNNPFLQDLEFVGPNVNDSLFQYWRGPDSLLTSRITFGSPAGRREYPWQVAMFVGGRYHCGASIIGDRFILTAAHCVISYKSNPSSLRLSMGDWDVSNNQDGEYIEGKVQRVTVHPSYSRSTLQNDLAVLTLAQPVRYSDRVQPICLPTTDIKTDHLQATITGWGRDENKQLKTILQELTSTITTNSLCGERWQQKKAPSGFIVDTMMCMDATNGDSCNGDSGGPAVMEYPPGSNTFIQIGIVSFGSGSCTDANLPGVYTRVTKFRDWIRRQMV